MASHSETINIRYDRRTVSVDETKSGPVGKHRKGRPSIDVELAQNYKERQALPPIEQGADPGFEETEDMSNLETEVVKIILDDGPKTEEHSTQEQLAVSEKKSKGPKDEAVKPKGEGPPRDLVTGCMISEEGRTCLRCKEKGLRCTLNYMGKESEPRCAACRRSDTEYCVSFRPWDPSGKAIPFTGPHWKSPNFAASTEDGPAPLSRWEMEALLREYHEGEKGYVGGSYIPVNDKKNFVMPPFNGIDLPEEGRPENYKDMTWKDALPIWQNRSLHPRKAATKPVQKKLDEREDKKKALTEARYEFLYHTNNPYGKNGANAGAGKRSKKQQADEGGPSRDGEKPSKDKAKKADTSINSEKEKEDDAGYVDDEKEEEKKKQEEEIDFFRIMRKYPPREQNLTDVLGETW